MEFRQLSLKQLLRRLLFALLISGLLTSGVSAWIFHSANEQAAETQRLNALQHYTAVIANLDQRWGREAFNFRIRLEAMHFLEDAAHLKERLLTHLTVQGESLNFSALRIEDARGELVASYEYGGHKIAGAHFRSGQETAWAFDAKQGRLYMAFRQPIWLGKENGYLTLYKQLDHALLTQYNYPGIRLSLWWNDEPIASSEGNDGLVAARPAFTQSGAPSSRNRLPWIGVDSGNEPILFIESTSPPLLGTSELALPVIITLIAFAFAIWAMIGDQGLSTLKGLLQTSTSDSTKS